MASLRFDGASDFVNFNLPAAVNVSSLTFAAVLRRRAVGAAWHAIIVHHDSAGTPRASFEFNGDGSGNVLDLTTITGAQSDGVTTYTSTTDWLLVAVTLAGGGEGGTTVRFHSKNLTTGSAWVHESGTFAISPPSGAAGGQIRVGRWQNTDDLNANVAVIGGWNAGLSDIQVEALATNLRTTDWTTHATPPKYVHELTSTTSIPDLMGNGATLVGVTGATLDTASPPTWTFINGGSTTYTKTGIGISQRIASGPKATNKSFSKVGMGIMGGVPIVKTGSATTALVASGASAKVLAGIINNKSGIGVMGTAHFITKTGIAISAMKASGTKLLGNPIETGTAITTMKASGSKIVAQSITYVKHGGGAGGSGTPSGLTLVISRAPGWKISGSKVVGTSVGTSKTGLGLLTMTASGSRARVITKTGLAITPLVASGANAAFNYAKAGTATTVLSASGTRSRTLPRTGSGVTPLVASGSDVHVTPNFKTGAAVSALVGSGSRAIVFTKTGKGVLDEVGSGRRTRERTYAGQATTTWTGHGADVVESPQTYTKAGLAVTIAAASGSRAMVRARTGIGVTPFVAKGTHTGFHIYEQTGMGVSEKSASGFLSQSHIYIETGTAASAWTATGSPVASTIYARTGTGKLVLGGRGARAHTSQIEIEVDGGIRINPVPRVYNAGEWIIVEITDNYVLTDEFQTLIPA